MKADFSVLYGKTGYAPTEIFFQDKSLGGPDIWLWEFGDGDISDLQNPPHIYSKEGQYTVSLTVFSGGNQDTKIKENYIVIVDIKKAEYELWGQGIYGRGTYYNRAIPSISKETITKEAINTSFVKEN